MARTRTSHIKNMNAGEVADDTREWFRVTGDVDVLVAVDAWDAYIEDFEEWKADGNPDGLLLDYQPIWEEEESNERRAPEFAAVVDRDSITDKEALFVEVRFWMEHDDGSPPTGINAPWCQVNSTNIENLQPGDFAIFRKVFNSRRKKLDLDPPIA